MAACLPSLRISVKAELQPSWGETRSTGEVARQELGGKRGSEKTGHAKTEAAVSVTTDRGLGGQHGRSTVPRNQDLGAPRKLPIWY